MKYKKITGMDQYNQYSEIHENLRTKIITQTGKRS